MPTFPTKVRGLNVVLVAFSLLVLGGSAYVMSNGIGTSFKSSASNVTQNISGRLVKKGTSAFSPCGKTDSSINYGVLSETKTCTPMSATSKLADPFVGKNIVATGNLKNGVFFATNLK